MDYETVKQFTSLAGLLFFVAIFVGIVVWAYRPSAKKKMQDYGNIPLNEDK